jgi:hypothetical protein
MPFKCLMWFFSHHCLIGHMRSSHLQLHQQGSIVIFAGLAYYYMLTTRLSIMLCVVIMPHCSVISSQIYPFDLVRFDFFFSSNIDYEVWSSSTRFRFQTMLARFGYRSTCVVYGCVCVSVCVIIKKWLGYESCVDNHMLFIVDALILRASHLAILCQTNTLLVFVYIILCSGRHL